MKTRRKIDIIGVIITILLALYTVIIALTADYTLQDRSDVININSELLMMITIGILYCYSALDRTNDAKRARGLFLMLLSSYYLQLTVTVITILMEINKNDIGVYFFYMSRFIFLYLTISVYMHYLYSQIVITRRSSFVVIKMIDVLMIMSAITIIHDVPMGAIIQVHDGVLTYGPNFYMTQIAPLVAIGNSFILLVRDRHLAIAEKLAFLSFIIVPLMAMMVQLIVPKLYIMDEGIFFSLLIIYATIYMQRGINFAKQDLENTNMKTAIVVSQIQPHFLFNSLNAIYYLAGKDAKLAQKAISDFSDYLRMNLDSMSEMAPVPFSKELKHVETYLWLEKLRFEDDLKVEYDIQAHNFLVPVLSIQPLVENAVRHGVCKKDDGGTVKISTRENEANYEIIIEDDGVGFDVKAEFPKGSSHVGIENTRKRLEMLCQGQLIIDSTPGKGTVCRVIIPQNYNVNMPKAEKK
ncbi:MAG: histidine kinase [Acetatifactor sp.]|nr:histidine kinase [Acetatifactor sp.]